MAAYNRSMLPLLLLLALSAHFGTGALAQVNKPLATQPQPLDDSTTRESVDLVKKLSSMLDTMGYKVEETKDDGVSFKIKNWAFYASSSKDASRVFLETWWSIPKEKVPGISKDQLLDWNRTHATYFSLNKQNNGGSDITLHVNFSTSELNARNLRSYLDLLDSDSNEADAFAKADAIK